MKTQPLVSIIVPTYNEEKVIRALLLSISKQKYKNIETIIIDDSSTDNTPHVAREFTPMVYIQGHAERSVQRNFGAKKSEGKFILFLDADMELTPKVVFDCVEKITSDNSIGGIVIPEVSKAETFWGRVKAFERSFYNTHGDKTTDAARFFSRAAFEDVGGYDISITGPEDWDLPESVKGHGYNIERVESKIIHHERVPGLLSLMRKKYYYGLKSNRYIQKRNISLVSPKTIYFLRPVFYKNWKKLVSNPILGLSMFIMFFFELLGGGLGYLIGKYIKR